MHRSTVCTNVCLKRPSNINNNKNNNNNNNNNNINRIKKSVQFDWHVPKEIRPPLTVKAGCCNNNYHSPVSITSPSSLSNGNTNGDNNDEQKKLYDSQRDIGTPREKKKIETTRTIITNPLTITTSSILRSFPLSPSSPSKEQSHDSRRNSEGEKENVDEPNYTTSQRVTTAATHLHCTTTYATVAFNDGSNGVSQKKESSTMDSSNASMDDLFFQSDRLSFSV